MLQRQKAKSHRALRKRVWEHTSPEGKAWEGTTPIPRWSAVPLDNHSDRGTEAVHLSHTDVCNVCERSVLLYIPLNCLSWHSSCGAQEMESSSSHVSYSCSDCSFPGQSHHTELHVDLPCFLILPSACTQQSFKYTTVTVNNGVLAVHWIKQRIIPLIYSSLSPPVLFSFHDAMNFNSTFLHSRRPLRTCCFYAVP